MIPRATSQFQHKDEQGPQKSDMSVWQETIEGTNGPLYLIRGEWLAGSIQANVGDTVYVEWKDGKPFRIIDYEVRRGIAHAVLGGAAKGVVEQLFLAPSTAPGGKTTVWFRNHNQITELRYDNEDGTRLYTDWANPAVDVFWGVNVDHFAVLEKGAAAGSEQFHVYRIKRQANLNKILATKAKVVEKVYSVKLADLPGFDLTRVTVHMIRDSVDPYVELFWFAAGAPGDPFNYDHSTLVIDPTTNENQAEVSRTVTIRLTGTTISFTDGAPIAASEIVVPSGIPPTSCVASMPEGYYMLDHNNDIIFSVNVNFVDFGLWQGNSTTGLTGSYHRIGEGTLTNAGVCFVIACPYIVDDVGIQDFMGHGNPVGVISTHITETHTVMINARQQTMVFSTFKNLVTLELEETSDGASPYRQVKMDPMPVITSQCYSQDVWQPTPGLHGIIAIENYGNLGDVGMFKSERSLFDPALSFQPDLPSGNDPTPGSPTRTAVVRVTVNSQGYDREWTDTFGQVCGAFSAVPFAVEGHWAAESIDVLDRYTVHVDVRPFTSKAGQLVSFVTVKRRAKKPLFHTSDEDQIGVFVLVGTSAFAVLPYTNVTTTEIGKAITFSSGNQKHVIWTRGEKWYISDYTTGVTKEVGSTSSKAETLQLVNPDLLYSYDEKKRYFVNGWNRTTGELTLTQTDDGKFPPKDTKIASLGTLKELTTATKGATKKDNHAIIDTSLVPEAYRT
jgi:hypothetical protein